MSPKIFVVVVTYRRRESLPVVLDLAATQSRVPDHVIVVDNEPNSVNEAAVARAAATGLTVEYVPSPENEGPAGARARGMRRVLELKPADDDWILTIDDDSASEDDASFGRLLEFAHAMVAEHSDTGAVARGGARFDRRHAIVSRLRTDELRGPIEVDTCATGSLPMYRVAAVRAVGPFDPQLFFGLEELELCLRLGAGGFRIFSDGTWHRERRAIRHDDGRRQRRKLAIVEVDWRRFYSTRNLTGSLDGTADGRPRSASRCGRRSSRSSTFPGARASPGPHSGFQVRAVRDGYRGTLGRTVEPSTLGGRAAASSPDVESAPMGGAAT